MGEGEVAREDGWAPGRGRGLGDPGSGALPPPSHAPSGTDLPALASIWPVLV